MRTANKIAPWVIEHTANGQQAEFMVVLADQADLRRAAALPTKNEKSRYVHDALWNKSQATQGPILQWLRERGLEYHSFYIVNAILVKGSREIAEALAARPDVARVEGNPQIQNSFLNRFLRLKRLHSRRLPRRSSRTSIIRTRLKSGRADLPARDIVVASADTGVRWTHNALKRHYRGWNGIMANHNYNWHDSVHYGGGNPAVTTRKRLAMTTSWSHTIGTAIGDDGRGNQIGMAPGAKWIGCRNMDQGNGTPARYIECMEFFLAPYPVGGTPARAIQL